MIWDWLFGKRDRERTCTRKQRCATKAIAKKACEAMHRKHGWRYSAYACSFCGGWHVGRKGFQFRFIVVDEKEGSENA
jgi:hypothetical protein